MRGSRFFPVLAGWVIIFSVALVAAWRVWSDYRSTVESAESLLSTLARSGDEQLSGILRAIDVFLQEADARLKETPEESLPQLVEYLNGRTKGIGDLRSVTATDENGIITFSTLPDIIGFDASQREYFKAAIGPPANDRLHFVGPVTTILDTVVMFASRPRRDRDGNFLGVVFVSMAPGTFENLVRSITPSGPTGLAALISENLSVIFRNPRMSNNIGPSRRGAIGITRHIASGARSTIQYFTSSIDRLDRIGAFRTISPYGTYILVSIASDEVFALFKVRLAAHGAFLGLISILTLVLVRRVQAREDALTASQRQLAEINENLEARIDGRTADLKASEERLRKLSRAVEQSPNMVFITDLGGVIEYVNPKFCQLSGYSADEAIGRTPRILQSGETPPEVYSDLWSTILAGNEWRGDLKDRRKDGQVFWALVAISPVRNDRGVVTHFVGMEEDITERKLAEQSVRLAKEEAEMHSRAKTEILANMSHELRTPLNAVIGFSETLLAGVFGNAPHPKFTEYLQDIHSSGSHLLAMINEILDVAAVETGKLELREQLLDVKNIVDAANRLILPGAAAEKVRVTTEIPPGIPFLRADERRVKQILLNLLSNAVKFTPDGGMVRTSVRLTPVGQMEIAVSDTGVSMDQEGIAKALTKFGQVDSGLARRHQGTGLGLPLAQGLVELHGGAMVITSEKGVGTTVTVIFPANRVERRPN